MPRWARPLVAGYPVLMGFMLVVNGEHYVVDILLGAAYTFGAHFLWNRIEAWWTSPHTRAGRGRAVLTASG